MKLPLTIDRDKAEKIIVEHEKSQAKHELIIMSCLLGIFAYLWLRR